ncbi:MAG: SMI1/KNR4 family protein [Vicinamibacteria bacterium]
MDEYEQAVEEIRAGKVFSDLVGPRPGSLVSAAEARLGIRFPPSFRRFALEWGAGQIGTTEICGVVDHQFEQSSVPNGVWLTLLLRKRGLPPDVLVIGEDALGGFVAIETTSSDVEAPVVLLEPGAPLPAARRTRIAESFGAYMLGVARIPEAH